MPKRDITEIMSEKAGDRMDRLLAGPKKPKPEPVPPIKKTLKGENPYRVLGVDAAQNDVIVRAFRVLDPHATAKTGPTPNLIGASRHPVNWRVGAVEHHALRLYRVAHTQQAVPPGCLDPNHLARVVIQQWYAQWGPDLEEATGLKPKPQDDQPPE